MHFSGKYSCSLHSIACGLLLYTTNFEDTACAHKGEDSKAGWRTPSGRTRATTAWAMGRTTGRTGHPAGPRFIRMHPPRLPPPSLYAFI